MILDPGVLTAAHFEPELNKVFLVNAAPNPLPITLIKVRSFPQSDPRFRAPFSIYFESSIGHILTEGRYEMVTESGLAVAFHMAPIQTIKPGVQWYQAMFN